MVLGLDRTPAAEVLPETIRMWTEDLWTARSWERFDASRIDHAFRVLRRSSHMWPQMVDFFECLPDRPAPPSLPPPTVTEEQQARRKEAQERAFAEMRKLLGRIKV